MDIADIGIKIRDLSARAVRSIQRWTAVLLVLCGVGMATYFATRIPQAVEYWHARTTIREMAREAKRYGLTYEAAQKKPDMAAGKRVEWFITHPAPNQWFSGAHHNRPIIWEGRPPDMAETGQSGTSHGQFIVAIVLKATPRGVTLRVVR